jgi:ribosomal protein S18 acetylase RimI-like enzyme
MATILRGGIGHLDEVVSVWAEATTARDGEPDVARLDIARVLEQNGAVLVVALDTVPDVALGTAPDAPPEKGDVLAFALAAPIADGERRAAEVAYVGVRPRSWGGGLGTAVMRLMVDELKAEKFDTAYLMVYEDNPAAVHVYEQLGWRRDGNPTPHPRTGRLERRYRLHL